MDLFSFVAPVTTALWSILLAVILLVVAFIVANIVKTLVLKLLSKTKLSELLGKAGAGENSLEFIGKLVYLLVFLLFVPGIFSALGVDSVTAPILGLLNTVWGFVPNLLAAIIILIVGFMVAKLVRQLLVPIFDKLKINKLQEKAGIEASDTSKLSVTLAYIVYVLILIPVIITALQALKIRAISDPAIQMLNSIFNFIPNILVALIIVVVGAIIGQFAGKIVERLIDAAGLDAKLSGLLDGKAASFSLSKVVGVAVRVVIVIFFLVEAFSVLNLQVLTAIGTAIIGYMPYVLSAVLILVIAFLVGSIVEKALRRGFAPAYALPAKVVILVVGVFLALNQLGIATEIVNTVFILIVAAVAVAVAIAFGVGGRSFAAKTLEKLEQKLAEPKDEPKE